MRALLLVFTSLAFVACSNVTTCPSTPPTDGESCSDRGFVCEENGGDHQRCSTISTCSNSNTTTWSNKTDATCTLTNDAACNPSYLATQDGSPCPTAGLSCDYTEGRCACVACSTATTTSIGWQCRAWDEGISPACPTERPAVGSACSTPSQTCRYDNSCTVSFGPDLQCLSGRWQPLGGAPQVCATPQCVTPA